jgi:hypothetical protein
MGQDPPKRPLRVHGYQSLARIGQGPYRNVSRGTDTNDNGPSYRL